MKKIVFSLMLLVTMCSCSTTEFNTDGRETFRVGVVSRSEKEVEIEVKKDFYYWGATPAFHELNFRDELEGVGLFNPSYVSVEQRHTFGDVFFTLITLGVYCPVTYKVTLLTNGKVK